MLLDLGRNDVGRVSEPGTVKVISDYVIEYYSHVMHIASRLEGKFEKVSMVSMLCWQASLALSRRAKNQAMDIIDELEPDKEVVLVPSLQRHEILIPSMVSNAVIKIRKCRFSLVPVLMMMA